MIIIISNSYTVQLIFSKYYNNLLLVPNLLVTYLHTDLNDISYFIYQDYFLKCHKF